MELRNGLSSGFRNVSPKFQWRILRYAILITAVVAAIVTPIKYLAPTATLYFLSFGVMVLYVTWRRNR